VGPVPRCMKVTTKCISGYGILIALMFGVLAYQITSINRMHSKFRDLESLDFQATLGSVDLMRTRDLVEEFTRKSLISGDPEYASMSQEYQREFTSILEWLQPLATSEKERKEVERLSGFWNQFQEDILRHRQSQLKPEETPPPALMEHLDRLRVQTQTLYNATRETIESEIQKSANKGAQAQWISLSAAALSLILSCLVSFVILRSIAEPLHNLTQGTRAITEGKFFYRLDTSRNDEFSQLAKDFNSMTQRLNELDQMKRDFVSHVSHELKAPLASMQEIIHLLLEQIPGSLNEKQKRLLELNFQSGRRLSSMLGNLLDLSRMEAGALEYELRTRDLGELVRTALAEFEVQAGEKSLQIKEEMPQEPVFVECDGDRIIQVIGNVIGNGIKFSRDGGVIRVALRTCARLPASLPDNWREIFQTDGKPFALVAVADSGPGIPDEHKQKIFERFHQVKQGKKIAGQGVGLGLAICRTIVEAHRGAIWVEDNPEGGSVISVLLPTGEAREGVTYMASSPI
jgi:two-component system, NtrC family, sensor histidine kinase GlrK